MRFTGKKLPVAALSGAIVLTVLYFFLTGSFFLTRFVLPALSRLTGVPMSAAQIDWRVFRSRITLRDFRMGGDDTHFLAVRRIHATYRPLRLVSGVLSFREVDASGVKLYFNSDQNAIWNYEKLFHLKRDSRDPDGVLAKLPPMEFFRVRFENSECHFKIERAGQNFQLSYTDLELTSPMVANGRIMQAAGSGRVAFSGGRGVVSASPFAVSGEIDWTRNFVPAAIRVGGDLTDWQTEIDRQRIDGGRLHFNLSMRDQGELTRLDHLLLQQTVDGASRSRLDLSGSFSMAPALRYQFDVRELHLADEVLALAADWTLGVNPGRVTLDGQGAIRFAPQEFASTGRWRLNRAEGEAVFGDVRLQLPGFEFVAEQDFALNLAKRTLEVRQLQAELTENRRSTLRLALAKPLQLDLTRQQAVDSRPRINLDVTDLDLTLLRFALPRHRRFFFTGGRISGRSSFDFSTSLDAAKIQGDFALRGAGVRWQQRNFDQLAAQLNFAAEVQPDLTLALRRLTLESRHRGELLGKLALSGVLGGWGRNSRGTFELTDVNDRLLDFLEPAAAPGAWRRQLAPLLPCSGQLTGKVELTPQRLRIDDWAFQGRLAREAAVVVRLGRQEFNRAGAALSNWKFDYEAKAPLMAANRYLPPDWQFLSGAGEWRGRFDCGPDFATALASGNIRLDDFSAKIGLRTLTGLSIEDEYAAYWAGPGKLQLNANALLCRIDGRPALRLETPGSFYGATGEWEGRIALRYVNENVLQMLCPGRIQAGLLSGTLRVSGVEFNRIRAAGMLAFEKLQGIGAAPVSGSLQLELEHRKDAVTRLDRCRLLLNRGPLQLIRADLTGRIAADPKKPLEFKLVSDRGDLNALCFQSGIQTAAPTLPVGSPSTLPGGLPGTPPGPLQMLQPVLPGGSVLNFGPRPIELTLELNDLNWGPYANFGLSGLFRLQDNRMETNQSTLLFHGSPFVFSAYAVDSARDGLMLATSGKAELPVELGTLVKLFRPGLTLAGNVESFRWDLQFRNLLAAGSLERMNGRIDAMLANVSIPSDALNSPDMRIWLLPVEAMVRAGALLPESADIRSEWSRLREQLNFRRSPFAQMKFDRGVLQLDFTPGALKLERVEFTGPLVRELRFTGRLELGGEGKLDLLSRVNLGGVRVSLPVRGTVLEPDLDLDGQDLLLALAGGKLQHLVRQLGGLFLPQKGSELRKLSPEEFERLKNELRKMEAEKPAAAEGGNP